MRTRASSDFFTFTISERVPVLFMPTTWHKKTTDSKKFLLTACETIGTNVEQKDDMSEKLNDTIRVRAGESLKRRVEKLAALLSKQQPAGSRKITSADVTRMALA